MTDADIITLALELAGDSRLVDVWPGPCDTIDEAHDFIERAGKMAADRRDARIAGQS